MMFKVTLIKKMSLPEQRPFIWQSRPAIQSPCVVPSPTFVVPVLESVTTHPGNDTNNIREYEDIEMYYIN